MTGRLVPLLLFILAGCGPDQSGIPPVGRDAGGADFGGACRNPPPDTDGDGISDVAEGAEEVPPRDTDGDGIPDFQDGDSDGDGIPDFIEGRNANPCTPPSDADGDGTPDFQDRDSDSATNSTVPDSEEVGPDPMNPVDTDGDGAPDFMDLDNDGDGIPDQFELTPPGQPVAATRHADAPDTDQDGLPDYLDRDADGDNILDVQEGLVDTDGDLTPNYRDLDSDNDCVPDAAEAGDTDPNTPPVDSDGDGTPDYLDRDSDNEGLKDGDEDANCNGVVDPCETDRLKPDTDGDGVTDLIEHQACRTKTPQQQAETMCACDGASGTVSPRTRGDFVFVVDYNQPPTPAVSTLDLSTDVSQGDVIFALDTTGSMSECLTNLASGLAGIVPQVKAKVASVAFGVLQFRDFGDNPLIRYEHRIQTVNTNAGIQTVQERLNALTAIGGGDYPEAGWEALYSIAGGPAITVGAYHSGLPLATTFPQPPTGGEVQGTLHGAGFRAGSVPIVVTVTDAEWHDAYQSANAADPEAGRNARSASLAGTPSRRTTIDRLNAIGAKVIGLAALGLQSSGDPKARARAVAQETGAVVTPADFGPVGTRPASCSLTQCCTGQDGAGEAPIAGTCPLSYTVNGDNGSGVSGAIVSGIVALASGLKFDIHVEARDVDPNTVDNFILKLQPNLTGLGPAAVCITTTPSPLQDNFTGPKATAGPDGVLDTFPQIGGGKRICFDVTPKMNTVVMNTEEPQLFRAQLQVRGQSGGNTVNLGTPREVFFLVPPVIKNGPIN